MSSTRVVRLKAPPCDLPIDPVESAKVAGLRYVNAATPGFRRRRAARGWVYFDTNGRVLRNPSELARIKALVIPPAWADVWICPQANGHLQAVGIDAKDRKQYRYHASYREVRDATKYARLAAFGCVLPKIRAKVEEDLKLSGLPKQKVQAALVRLLETVSVRVGNEEYARTNESFGLTTLRDVHLDVEGSTVRLRFIGKSAQEHDIELNDRRLARILVDCQDLPGQELFQYLNGDNEPCKIYSEDVNSYIRDVTGEDFTAKDFRTWNGTREALLELYSLGPASSATDAKKKVVEAVKRVARTLRNRPATCRKYYVHPAVLSAFEQGTIFDVLDKAVPESSRYGLRKEEVGLLKILSDFPPVQVLRGKRARKAAA